MGWQDILKLKITRGRKFGPQRIPTPRAKRRLQRKKAKEPTKYEPTKLRENRQKYKNHPEKINQIIIDYFTMYNRRFGRNPTLQDIQNEEGRPLTVDEIESFKRYAQGR